MQDCRLAQSNTFFISGCLWIRRHAQSTPLYPGERFISVMPLEEDKRFLCFYVSNFCRFANRARCQDIDQGLLHGAVLGTTASIRSKLPTAVCWSRAKREEGVELR